MDDESETYRMWRVRKTIMQVWRTTNKIEFSSLKLVQCDCSCVTIEAT